MNLKLLTKTDLLQGVRCLRRLFLLHLEPGVNEDAGSHSSSRFYNNYAVIAFRRLYPQGIQIEKEAEPEKALTITEKLLAEIDDGIFFDPAFTAAGIIVRPRILIKRNGSFRIIEVKASASYKGHYVLDCAIQTWVMESAGFKVESVEITHLNKDFVYCGREEYRGLFLVRDITEEVRSHAHKVPDLASRCASALKGALPVPEETCGCRTLKDCRFVLSCGKKQSEYSISILAASGRFRDKLDGLGYKSVAEVPEGLIQRERQRMIYRAILSGIPEVHPYVGIRLSRYGFPRYFIDFETVQFAVPIWEGTRPFEQLLFQWSCHRIDADNEKTHTMFLDLSGAPPMESAASRLSEVLGKEGPVFTYGTFEKMTIWRLICRFPRLSDALEGISKRIVDIQPLLKKYYYHKSMAGSWSIKSVLPTIAPELAYENLEEVKSGRDVHSAYMEAIAPETCEKRRAELYLRLSEYCERDTLALVRIVEFFERTAKERPSL